MGGMRAIEWAVMAPDRVGAIAPVGSTAATTADQIAWSTSQLAAIRADPKFRGGDYYDAADGDGPHVGMGIARMIAHTTYRSEGELAERFGRTYQGDGDPLGKGGRVRRPVLPRSTTRASSPGASTPTPTSRFVQSIQSHDVGRGPRRGRDGARSLYDGPALVVAVDSDRLYPLKNSQRLDACLSAARTASRWSTPPWATTASSSSRGSSTRSWRSSSRRSSSIRRARARCARPVRPYRAARSASSSARCTPSTRRRGRRPACGSSRRPRGRRRPRARRPGGPRPQRGSREFSATLTETS